MALDEILRYDRAEPVLSACCNSGPSEILGSSRPFGRTEIGLSPIIGTAFKQNPARSALRSVETDSRSVLRSCLATSITSQKVQP